MIEKEVNRQYYCPLCEESHKKWHKEVYNHNPRLSPIWVCEKCGVGFEQHEITEFRQH